MSSQTSTPARPRINKQIHLCLLVLALTFLTQVSLAWEIDLSRRVKHLKTPQLENPSVEQEPTLLPVTTLLSPRSISNHYDVAQDIVILNTESGFIPKTLSLKQNTKYRVHVVNVNSQEKNVSFILSSFDQYHGTYFGLVKSFEVTPTQDGVFTYQCPETSQEGRMVVLPNLQERGLASQN